MVVGGKKVGGPKLSVCGQYVSEIQSAAAACGDPGEKLVGIFVAVISHTGGQRGRALAADLLGRLEIEQGNSPLLQDVLKLQIRVGVGGKVVGGFRINKGQRPVGELIHSILLIHVLQDASAQQTLHAAVELNKQVGGVQRTVDGIFGLGGKRLHLVLGERLRRFRRGRAQGSRPAAGRTGGGLS